MINFLLKIEMKKAFINAKLELFKSIWLVHLAHYVRIVVSLNKMLLLANCTGFQFSRMSKPV